MSKLCAVCRAVCRAIRLKPPALAMNRWDPYFYSPSRYIQPVNSTDIFLHYSSFEELQQSGNRGCPICALFVRDILEHTKLRSSGFGGKIYLRWYRTSVELEEKSARYQLERTFIPAPWNCTESCHIQWNRLELLSYDGQATVEELSTQSVYGAASLSYITGQALPPFNSDETFRTIKDWINACSQDHSPTNCPRHLDEILPTRVIDVASSRDSIVSLHVSTNMRGTYVALSHVWGGEISCKLKMKLLEGWTRSIDVNELPRSFQDAITVTRNLGLRYLWIDALCIVQDSPKDWQQESSRMGGVFKNAFLTIAISATAQTQEGFLTRKSTDRTSFMLETASANGQSCGYEYLRREVSPQGAIDTRGWCLQENALSTRMLTFTPDECFFDCRREYVISESGAYSFHDSRYDWAGGGLMVTLSKALEEFQQSQILDKTRYTAICEQIAAHWYAMIGGWRNGTGYTSRHLTYSSDRLPALSGLAHEVQRVIQCKYLAGIWECHLLAGLLWKTLEVVGRRWDSSANRNPVPQGNGDPQAPSWSWAASNCPVSYPSPGIRQFIDGIRIIDTGTITDGTDPMGRVSSGWITLNGPVLEMCCLWKQATPSNAWAHRAYLVISNNIEGGPFKPEQTQHMDDPDARLNSENYIVTADFDDERCISSTVTCLAFCSPVDGRRVHGLMLRSTDREGECRRVGCWMGWAPHTARSGATFEQLWTKFTRRTITLV